MTDTKPQAPAFGAIPLLVDRKWIRHNLGIGTTSIIELEKAGVLKAVEVPGIRAKKYEGRGVLAVLGLAAGEERESAAD
jgi:hypothetical protein